jgi:hypothetical protein
VQSAIVGLCHVGEAESVRRVAGALAAFAGDA